MTCSGSPEPKASASSSPDERCKICGHARSLHHGEYGAKCAACVGQAEPEPGTCIRPNGCKYLLTNDCEYGCREAADELTRQSQGMEPEAPGCAHIGSRTTASGDGPRGPWHDFKCDECGASWRRTWSSETRDWDGEPEARECEHPDECQFKGAGCVNMCSYEGMFAPKAQPPRRPPYAVAYVLQDGTHYEVALPGDATVCALDGALLITHTQSPVQGLTQARPMED